MNGHNPLNRLMNGTINPQSERPITVSIGLVIDIVVGLFLVLPHLSSNLTGLIPILLTVFAMAMAALASLLMADQLTADWVRTWYRTRNAFYIGALFLFFLPVMALMRAHSTLNMLGASFGPLLLTVHFPIFFVFGNLVLSFFIGRRLENDQAGQGNAREVELQKTSSMFGEKDL